MIVGAHPLEVIKRRHFEVGPRQWRGQFLANRIQYTNARLLFDALGKRFLGSRRSFLGRRLVACDSRMDGTAFVAADVKHLSGLRAVDYDGRLGLRALCFSLRRAVLPFMQDIGVWMPGLPRRSL